VLGKDDPRRIGRQALGVNLSDLAAMAAKPLAAVVSLVLPRGGNGALDSLQLAIALYEGLLPLAEEFDVAIAGGDTNTYDGPLVLSVTALGQLTNRAALTRSGGRAGDWLLVTGSLGGSILGHLFDFTPRVREAIALHERYELNAGIDISDGLALDLSRLAMASNCGAVIYMDRVPISDDAQRLAEQEGANDRPAAALRHALSDGQDFELLLAASPPAAQAILQDQPLDCRVTHVGELVPGTGIWQQDPQARRAPLEPIGWVHL
jgi:thiamine-monophosphate kinase